MCTQLMHRGYSHQRKTSTIVQHQCINDQSDLNMPIGLENQIGSRFTVMRLDRALEDSAHTSQFDDNQLFVWQIEDRDEVRDYQNCTAPKKPSRTGVLLRSPLT